MTIGHGNWNGIGMAAILAFLGASAMLQRCSGNAAEMLWWCHCCHAAINVAALLQLGAKQGQDLYLAGQLLPSFLRITGADTNHACHRYVWRLHWAWECQCTFDCWFQLIAMDASTPATACIAAPEWFWFGLLLLLLFTLPVAPSQSTLSTLTCLGHHNRYREYIIYQARIGNANALSCY